MHKCIYLSSHSSSPSAWHSQVVQGGEDTYVALSCRSLSAKEPLIIGLFCRKMTFEDKASYYFLVTHSAHLKTHICMQKSPLHSLFLFFGGIQGCFMCIQGSFVCVQASFLCVGIFYMYARLFCVHTGLFCLYRAVLCVYRDLFCVHRHLFWS